MFTSVTLVATRHSIPEITFVILTFTILYKFKFLNQLFVLAVLDDGLEDLTHLAPLSGELMLPLGFGDGETSPLQRGDRL